MQNKFNSSVLLDGEGGEMLGIERTLEFGNVLALHEGLVLVTPAVAL